MKTKKIIIAVCTLLMLAAVISVSVYAGMFAGGASRGNAKYTQTNTETEAVQTEAKESAITLHGTLVGPDDYYASNSFVNENAEPEKVYVIGDESIPLKLEGSIILESGNYIDVYNDAEGNVYSFDENGELSSYDMNNDIFIDKMQYSVGNHKEFGKDYIPSAKLTPEDAIELAEKTAKKYFGDKFDIVEFKIIGTNMETDNYYVHFYQKLGSEKYIRGIHCTVGIMSDHSISCCSMENYYDLKDFDISILDGITKEALYSDLETKIREMHGDNLVSYEIVGIDLKVKNGTYYIDAAVDATVNRTLPDGEITAIADGGQRYRYTLPQN